MHLDCAGKNKGIAVSIDKSGLAASADAQISGCALEHLPDSSQSTGGAGDVEAVGCGE